MEHLPQEIRQPTSAFHTGALTGRLQGLRALGTGLWVLAGAILVGPAAAQTGASDHNYPNQPIKLVVPFSAGGGTDVLTRVLAEQIAPKLGQPVVVENRPGASAAVGAASVVKAAPNGYTLLVGTATLAANEVVSGPNQGFSLLDDFDYIAKIGQIDLIIMVNGKSSINDLQGLVNMMRTQPGKVSFGSPGMGAPGHLGGELLKQLTKADALHVPYKGESAALNDLLGGVTTFQLCSPSVCVPRIASGQLKGLAVAAPKRSKMAPNIPTTAEAGVPGLEAGTWYYIAAPKGTPPAILDKLNSVIVEVQRDEKYRKRLLDMGYEIDPATNGAAVKAELKSEMDKWRPVAKAAGLTPN